MDAASTTSEIELLRARVAVLEELLHAQEQGGINRSLSMGEATRRLELHSGLLNALVTATDPSHGTDLFHVLAYHLAATLKVRYVLVGEFYPQENTGVLRTIAAWANGEFVQNFNYQLEGMPCAHLVRGDLLYCEADAQRRFPQAQLMKDWRVEGYCGIPVYGRSRNPIGFLAVLDCEPLRLPPETQTLLMVVASRVGAEMERTRADEALRKSEERYARATAAGKVGVWELDCSNGTYHGDANLKALYGYREEELGTDPYVWVNLVHPDDRATAMGSWQAVASGERDDYFCSLRMVRKDGTIIWTEARGQAYRDEQGRLLRLAGATVDLTDRKQAEVALAQTLADLRNITDSVPDVLYTLDTDGRLIRWNKRVEEVTGYTPEELKNRPAVSFVPESERSMVAGAIERAFREGYAEVEGHMLTKDGKIIPFHWTGATLKNPEGIVIGLTGIGRDTTERKRAEIALRDSGEKLRQALHASGTGLWEWNTVTHEASLSREWKRQLGYEEAELKDAFETWELRLHPDDRERALAYVRAYLTDPIGDYQQEFRLRHRDGSYRWIEARASFVVDPDGRRDRLLGSHTDITDRKRVEESLRQREQEIQTVLRERERISEDLHDGILQSLYAVGLGLESCKPLIRQRKHGQATALLDHAVRQMNHLMTEVRNFIAGLESQVLQGVDFATALETMVQALSVSAAIACRVSIDGAAARQISTEQALHLMNVVREALSNSLRHSQARRITVSLKDLAQVIRLSVADDGVGFKPAAAYGVGHGLTNMLARAQKIGGRFAVRSRPLKGTTILLDLHKETVRARH